nr:unnamed protein product [Digitaria exilis]
MRMYAETGESAQAGPGAGMCCGGGGRWKRGLLWLGLGGTAWWWLGCTGGGGRATGVAIGGGRILWRRMDGGLGCDCGGRWWCCWWYWGGGGEGDGVPATCGWGCGGRAAGFCCCCGGGGGVALRMLRPSLLTPRCGFWLAAVVVPLLLLLLVDRSMVGWIGLGVD